MYALNEQVNQVFFGILLIDEQLEQNHLLEEDLQRNLKNIRAYRDNGIANDADVDAVQVEILNTRQQRTQLTANRTAYLRMLSLLTGKPLDEQTQLIRPVSPDDKTAFRIAGRSWTCIMHKYKASKWNVTTCKQAICPASDSSHKAHTAILDWTF